MANKKDLIPVSVDLGMRDHKLALNAGVDLYVTSDPDAWYNANKVAVAVSGTDYVLMRESYQVALHQIQKRGYVIKKTELVDSKKINTLSRIQELERLCCFEDLPAEIANKFKFNETIVFSKEAQKHYIYVVSGWTTGWVELT